MKVKNEGAEISSSTPKKQGNISLWKKCFSWNVSYDSSVQLYWGYVIALIYQYKSCATIYKLIIDVWWSAKALIPDFSI